MVWNRPQIAWKSGSVPPTQRPRQISPQRPRRVSAAAVVASALMSGVGSYVLIIIVAKSVSTDAYAQFAVFWSIAAVVGLGVYFPIEQETARDFAGRERAARGRLRRVAFGFAGLVSAILVALSLALLAAPAGVEFIGSPALIVALCVAYLGYFIQFPTRGLLSGAHHAGGYAVVVSTEGIVRIAFAALVALAAATIPGLADPAVFALAVGVAAALSALPAFLRRFRVSEAPHGAFGPFSSRASQLIAAAFAIQLLINSSVLIARGFAETDATLAGQLLSTLAIARIPVFMYQVVQVLYMPHLASAWKRGAVADARRTVVLVAAGVAAIGVLTVGGMLWLGPWVIGLFFTPELVLAAGPLFLLTTGVALFLLAQALSDAALACGGHTVLLGTWLAAAAAAVVSIFLTPDSTARTVVPLVVGSAVACLGFAVFLTLRLGRQGNALQ